MVWSVQRALTLFVTAISLSRSCYALSGGTGFSWGFENRGIESSTLTECETLTISLASASGDSSNIGTAPYYLLEFEPSGTSTATLVGHTPSDLRWQVKRRAGSQLLLSLVDSQGTSGGVHPMLFTVATDSTDGECLRADPLSAPLSPLQPEIASSAIGQIPPCAAWDLSVSGGRPPYTISVVSLGSPTVHNFSLSSGQKSFTYNDWDSILGRTVAAVSDSRGLFGMTTSIVDISSLSSHIISCLASKSLQNPYHAHRFRRRTVNLMMDWSQKDIIAFAVCVSLGGTVVLAAAAVAVVSYRRRKRGLMGGQDTLPRPFEITVPAPTTTAMSMSTSAATLPRLNVDVSLPVLDISSRNNSATQSQTPPGTPRRNAPRLRQMPSSSSQQTEGASTPRGPRIPQPRPSDSSLRSSHEQQAGPSPYSHDYSRSGTSSRTVLQSPRTVRASPSPAEPLQTTLRTRKTKGGLYTSRSASDMYRAASSVPRYRMHDHENLQGGPSTSRHAHLPQHAHPYPPPHVHPHPSPSIHTHTHQHTQETDASAHGTHYLRHYHSASPIVRPGRSVEVDMTLQHHNARAMQEPPPPYH